MQRLLCIRCEDSIHPDTAARNEGLCMPCVRGNQLSIEQRTEQHRSARDAERAQRDSPESKYWSFLIDRVYRHPGGFDALSKGDRLYYLLGVLSGEVYNGGFDQFFSNTSGNRFMETVAALEEVEAYATLALLQKAKSSLFVDVDVPVDRAVRYGLMITSSEEHPDYVVTYEILDKLDKSFYRNPDELMQKLKHIASTHGLFTNHN